MINRTHLFENKLYSLFVWKHGFWFRFLNIGFEIRNWHKNPLLFSERNGYVKGFKIGKYYIKKLNKIIQK